MPKLRTTLSKMTATDYPEENSPVDFYFAKRIAPQASEQVFYFLANLLKAAREGHLCIPAEANLHLPEHLFEEALVEENGRIYLRRNWECEQRFLKHFHRLKNQEPMLKISKLTFNESLEPEQKQAIFLAAQRSLSLICGGPGTGKTFTATTLIRRFLPYLNSVGAAPTGKAAANLRRALNGLCPVMTLHALLRKRYLTADLVLVDEASMIDAELMAALFAAVKQGARLVLIGDKDQLPPVESGNFFSDMAEDREITAELGRCLRTELYEIVEMAQAVKLGKIIPCQPLPDFSHIVEEVFEQKTCVLTPLRYGPWGTNHLNQKLLKEHLKQDGKRLPIMIRTNDPAIDLYNGDLGELAVGEKCAFFGDRRVPEYLLPHYEYAYVLSVHKSQGSEYDSVVVLLPEGSEVFGREMLYTAITRAKKRLSIHAADGVLSSIVSKRDCRLSGLWSTSVAGNKPPL